MKFVVTNPTGMLVPGLGSWNFGDVIDVSDGWDQFFLVHPWTEAVETSTPEEAMPLYEKEDDVDAE